MSQIIPQIIDQHFENVAAVLPSLLLGTSATNDDLAGLKDLQSTLLANLDGLKISSSEGRSHILSELSNPDAGEVFALGAWALLASNEDWWQETLTLAQGDSKILSALVEVLDCLPIQRTQKTTDALIQNEDPNLKWLGLEARLRQRRPLDPKTWTGALKSEDGRIRACAFCAIGVFGEMRLAKALSHGINDDDATVKYQALRAAALLGDARVAVQIQSIALSDSPFAYEALDTVCRMLRHRQVIAWIRALIEGGSTRKTAIEAIGLLGDPAAMSLVLKAMEDDDLAQIAAEAFIRITGVDMQDEKLEKDAPEGFESGPNDDPDDDDVDMDPLENMPWPNPEACQKWWTNNKLSYRAGTRYLLGKPLENTHLIHALKVDTLKYRHGHATQLAFNKTQSPLFPTKAPPSHQLHLLSPMNI